MIFHDYLHAGAHLKSTCPRTLSCIEAVPRHGRVICDWRQIKIIYSNYTHSMYVYIYIHIILYMQIITISILIRGRDLKKETSTPAISDHQPGWDTDLNGTGRGETFPELRGQTMRPGPECRTTGCASPVKDETIKKLMGYKYGYVEDESISLFYADYIHIMGLWDYHGHMYTYIYIYLYTH